MLKLEAHSTSYPVCGNSYFWQARAIGDFKQLKKKNHSEFSDSFRHQIRRMKFNVHREYAE
jgi:hypothetical protein